MKIAAYGLLVSVMAVGTAAQVAAPAAVQYGALGLLGWMCWYILARAFPVHIKAQQEDRAAYLAEQRETRREFTESLDDLGRSLDYMTGTIQGCQLRSQQAASGGLSGPTPRRPLRRARRNSACVPKRPV